MPSDNFNRADGALGANWTLFGEGGMTISSNQAIGVTGHGGAYWTGDSFGSDQSSEIQTTSSPITGGQFTGVSLRTQNGGLDCYLGIYFSAGGPVNLRLYKRVSGVSALLGSYACGTLPAGSRITLTAVGNHLTLLLDGVARVEVDDTAIPSGGAPGMMTYDAALADNWVGATVPKSVAITDTGFVAGSGVSPSAEIGYHPANPAVLSSGTFADTILFVERQTGNGGMPLGPGLLTELHLWVEVGSGRKFRFVVYGHADDLTDRPGALLYASPEQTTTGDGYWHDLTGLSVNIDGGPLWLGVYNADSTQAIRFNSSGGVGQYHHITYSAGGALEDPYTLAGSAASTTQMALYGVYTQTALGYTRGSLATNDTTGPNGGPLLFVQGPFAPQSAGTLTELHMYCVAGTGKKVRFCVYADSAGVPGTLIYASAEQSPVDNSWLVLTGLSVALSGAPVWIGAFSNDGAFSVKYILPTINRFYSVSNTYHATNPPASPFPSGTAATVLFDMYGLYSLGATDSVVRQQGRTPTDSGLTFGETLTRSLVASRSITDTGAAIADTAALPTTAVVVTDTAVAHSDTTAVVRARSRAASDVAATVTESLARTAVGRVLSDTAAAFADAAYPSQRAAPISDVSAGGWTAATSLWSEVDEPVADDANEITSSATANDTAELALRPLRTPLPGSGGHKLRYRIKRTGVSPVAMQVSLLQGAAIIATWTHASVPSSYTTYEQVLTDPQQAAITDYANLRVRLVANT